MNQLNSQYSFAYPYCSLGQWIRTYYGVQSRQVGLPDRVRHHIYRTQSPVGTFIREHWWALNRSSSALFEPVVSLHQTIVTGVAEPAGYEFDPRWPDADLLVPDQTEDTPMPGYTDLEDCTRAITFEQFLSQLDSNPNFLLQPTHSPWLIPASTQSELQTIAESSNIAEPAPTSSFGPHEDPTDIFTWDFWPADQTQGPAATLDTPVPFVVVERDEWWNQHSGRTPKTSTLSALAPTFYPQSQLQFPTGPPAPLPLQIYLRRLQTRSNTPPSPPHIDPWYYQLTPQRSPLGPGPPIYDLRCDLSTEMYIKVSRPLRNRFKTSAE